MERVLTNYHTHTVYCDGAHTPREMAQAALDRGFYALGFSGHSDDSVEHFGMDEQAYSLYKADVLACKLEYAGRLAIYLGLEVDSCCPAPEPGLDYTLGSVHYILAEDGRHYCIDISREPVRNCINKGFGGDSDAFVRAYYQEMRRMLHELRPDIVGHFDVLTKFNGDNALFDAQSPAYRRAAIEALECAVTLGCIVEVNTGGMARGYRSVPYPDTLLLKSLRALGGSVIISSDAHDMTHIDHAFDTTAALLYEAGFRERMELGPEGFHAVRL